MPQVAAVPPKWYFVVLDTAGRREILGWEDGEGKMTLSMAGKIIRACWLDIPRFFHRVSRVTLGPFSIRPDHLRALIAISGENSPLRRILSGFKFRSTLRLTRFLDPSGGFPPPPLWEKRHSVRLLRGEDDTFRIMALVTENVQPPTGPCDRSKIRF